jgi:hypothetical protein
MTHWLGGFGGAPGRTIELWKDWFSSQPRMEGLRLIALHNTGAPNMHQTDATPGGYDQRQRNIGHYYQGMGWRGGPAWDVYPDGTIRDGTPWPLYGIH